jgi:hypothetical protein
MRRRRPYQYHEILSGQQGKTMEQTANYVTQTMQFPNVQRNTRKSWWVSLDRLLHESNYNEIFMDSLQNKLL